MGFYACAALAVLGCTSSNGPTGSSSTDGSIDHLAAEEAADVTTAPDDVQSAREATVSDAPHEADASAIHESPDASLDAGTQAVDAPSYDGSCVATWHLGGGQCNWMVDCPGDASFHATCFYLTPPMNCTCNNGSTVISQSSALH